MSKKTFYLLLALVCILCISFTYTTIKYPHIGIEVDLNKNGQYEIINVFPKGAAEHLGLMEGDILLQVNGDAPEHHLSIVKHMLVERAYSMEVQRHGVMFHYDVQSRFYPDQVLLHIFFPFLILFLSFGFSIFLFNNKKNEKATFVLIILLQLYGVSFFAGAASARLAPFGQFCSIIILLLIPLILIQFFVTYFKKHEINIASQKILLSLNIANISLVILSSVLLFLTDNNQLYILAKSLVLVMFIINVLSCFFYFGRGFFQYRKSAYSSIFKIILVGILLSFLPFILLYALPTIIMNKVIISAEVGFLFTYFLPLTFVYLMTANRFLDIDFYIKRTYYYSLFALLPAVLLTVVCGYFIPDFSISKWLQVFVIVYLMIIIIFYAKEELDYRFRRKLFFEKNNLQSSTYQFVQFLANERNSKVIEKHFVKEVKSVLALKNTALLQFDKQDDQFILKNGDDWEYDREELKSLLCELLGKDFIGEYQEIGSIYFIIIAEDTKKALVLVLGNKRNFTSLNLAEKEWLKTIAYFMNISYQNLQLINKLIEELENIRAKENAPSWVLRMLFQLEEKERKRLSTDLHDSALQDQLLLYQKLTGILEDYHFEPYVKEELAQINERILDVVHDIRETCNDLMPPFLKETGMIGSLENLIKKAQMRTNLVINFSYDQGLSISLQDDVMLAIYRVVQELINNAEKHSNATNIHINLGTSFDYIILQYKDDGNGYDEKKFTVYNEQIGINGIKERVRSVDGNIHFSSAIDGGLAVRIEIPLHTDYSILRE